MAVSVARVSGLARATGHLPGVVEASDGRVTGQVTTGQRATAVPRPVTDETCERTVERILKGWREE